MFLGHMIVVLIFFMLCDFSRLIGLNAGVLLACGKLKPTDSILFEFFCCFSQRWW